MMKFLLLGFSLLMSFIAMASTYKSMEFKTSDGTTYIVSADDLIISLSGDMLVINNSSNIDLRLDAVSVIEMKFSDNQASADNVASDVDSAVSAYTTAGIFIGNFSSVQESVKVLSAGTYLLNGSNGRTIKLIVGQ